MTTLLCIGFGYCAQHYAAEFGSRFERIVGTTRSVERAEALAGMTFGERRVEMLVFDGRTASRPIISALKEADALLISAGPADGIDPVLAVLADEILRAPHLSTVVLLSTLSVYGDHGGAVVSETTPPEPVTARGRGRLDAERAWETLGARRSLPVACLRLAGIYGPGQNALLSVARGTARRINKPGQVFNRIHVADIAQAIDAAFAQRANGVFNVTDDEPSPPGDPIAFAAQLLQTPVPPEIDLADAVKSMTPMALSFYRESKRVDNARLKNALGITLRYPTYRDGLRALHKPAGVQPET
ncbi:MAG: NAD-dependent epimerase/dehydratase family protein [Xanthobacteraceae bacterium]